MTRTELRKLACCPSYGILVALSTGGRVEHRAEPALGIMSTLKLLLVESEGITGRFGLSVANALRAWIVDERRGIKASRRFGQALLTGQRERNHQGTPYA